MRLACKNAIRLPSGATLDDFLVAFEKFDMIPKDVMEICVPESYALREESLDKIDGNRCYGCLNCIDIGDIDNIAMNGIPCSKCVKNSLSMKKIGGTLFSGIYFAPGQLMERLARHTARNERRVLNPMAALYFWRLSASPPKIGFCSSPNGELSIDVDQYSGEREGHLDVAISSAGSDSVCVLEGKACIDAFLRDINRDQWNKYRERLNSIAKAHHMSLIFSYLIGGDELCMYPESCDPPHHNRRAEFFDAISQDNKRFISIGALWALRVVQMSRLKKWNWEQWLPKLFSDERFVGLLSGGVIYLIKGEYIIKPAPWI